MYFLVSLKTLDKTKIIVPSKWIKHIKLFKLLNYGVKYHKKEEYTVFFSKNLGNEPDFSLQNSVFFNNARDSCYIGSILKTFSE